VIQLRGLDGDRIWFHWRVPAVIQPDKVEFDPRPRVRASKLSPEGCPKDRGNT
jgi:hypothetical protein